MSDALKLRARRGDIMALGQLTVPKFKRTWYHEQLAELVAEVVRFARYGGERGGTPRALVSMPRRRGKSLFCGELGPASMLGMAPDLKVMNTAYSGGLASERVEGTRRIMTSEDWPFPVRIGRVFDDKTGRTKQAKDKAFHFRTLLTHPDGSVSEPGGSYQAVGLTGGATGHGYHFGIIDDWTKNEQDANSPAMRLQRESFFDTCFESGQEGTGALLAVGTMWTKPDWLNTVNETWVAQGFDPVWLRFPALKDSELSYDLDNDPREEGEGLHLHSDATEHYERIRAGLFHRKQEHRWLSLYQQDPRGQGGIIFPKNVWRYFESDFDLGYIRELHMSIDPNQKATGRSFGAIGVYGVVDLPQYGGVQYFKLDNDRGHWDYNGLRAHTKQMWAKWQTALPSAAAHPSSTVWAEDTANGPALMADTETDGIPFQPVPKMRSKESCYRLASPIPKQGRVRLPMGEFPPDSPVTSHWVQGPGGFIEELYSQQPTKEPNDNADQFAQMIICREPNLGPELLRL